VELEDDFTELDSGVTDLNDEDIFVVETLLDEEGFFVLDEDTFFKEQGVLVGAVFLVDKGVGEGFFVELVVWRFGWSGSDLGSILTPRDEPECRGANGCFGRP
jgi:hypothetical protein